MKAALQKWIEGECRTIEEGMARNYCTKKKKKKEAYQLLKTLTKADQHKTSVIEDNNGGILTPNRCTEYCKDLCKFQLKTDANIKVIKAPYNNERSTAE